MYYKNSIMHPSVTLRAKDEVYSHMKLYSQKIKSDFAYFRCENCSTYTEYIGIQIEAVDNFAEDSR